VRVLTISVTSGCMHANPPEIETNREAKDENAIRQPKSLLWKMQKSTSYFEGKLRLLYKMKGLDSLYDKYKESIELETRVRQPSMFYTFSKRKDVMDSFEVGKPLSCFCLDNNYHKIHVAVALGDCSENKKEGDNFAYLTFDYNVELWFRREVGVHFCQFKLMDEKPTTANKSSLNFTDYAVMLPFKNKGSFRNQYTLIYSDWEVLICEGDNVKGQTPVSCDLYKDVVNPVNP
jgi:hypothetical protein